MTLNSVRNKRTSWTGPVQLLNQKELETLLRHGDLTKVPAVRWTKILEMDLKRLNAGVYVKFEGEYCVCFF